MSLAKSNFRLVTAERLHPASAPEESVVLVGPPGDLRGRVLLRNPSSQPLYVRELPVAPGETQDLPVLPPISVRARLAPETEQFTDASITLDPTTPPGTYSARLWIGESERSVQLVVQPVVQVELSPTHFDLVGIKPGGTHEVVTLLTNQGNVRLRVPPLLYAAPLDADAVCRSLNLAVRRKGNQGAEATLDVFVQSLHEEMAGFVQVKVKEGDQVVTPGEALLLHLTLRVPMQAKKDRCYAGNLTFLGRTISYALHPGPNTTDRTAVPADAEAAEESPKGRKPAGGKTPRTKKRS